MSSEFKHRRSHKFVLGHSRQEWPKIEAKGREQGIDSWAGVASPFLTSCKCPRRVYRANAFQTFGRTESTQNRNAFSRKCRLVTAYRFYLNYGALPILDSWGLFSISPSAPPWICLFQVSVVSSPVLDIHRGPVLECTSGESIPVLTLLDLQVVQRTHECRVSRAVLSTNARITHLCNDLKMQNSILCDRTTHYDRLFGMTIYTVVRPSVRLSVKRILWCSGTVSGLKVVLSWFALYSVFQTL